MFNDNRLIEDIQWLTQECTLPYFSEVRLPLHELEIIKEKVLNLKGQDRTIVYDIIFEKLELKKPHWHNNLKESSLPALALIPNEGMCIIIELESDNNWKSECEDGIKSYKSYPSGTIFTSIKSQRKLKDKHSAKEMFKAVAFEQKNIIMHAIIASLSINFLALSTSFFSMQVYDRVIPTQGIPTLIALCIGVSLAILLEMILKLSRSHIFDHAAINMDTAYSHDIFKRFLKIRLDSLPKSIGTLSGQLQNYSTVRTFISSAALYIFIDFPFSMIFLVVIIMISGWMMGAIVVAFLVVAIISGLFFRKKIEHLTKTSSMASHQKLGLLVESVENSENIKSTGSAWSILSRWNALSEDSIHDDIKIRHYSEMSSYIAILLQQFSYIALVSLGAYLVSTTNDLTMGGLIATTILSGRVLSPIAMLPNLLVQWGRTKIAVEDLDRVYTLECDNEGISSPLSPSVIKTDFLCENISFSYGENRQALKVDNLKISTGERVAILGMIGSGKSTLLKVLSGLYKPQEGKVLLNSIDIQHISRNKVNENVGYLSQNIKLISGTLRDNLVLGLTRISDEKIIEVSKKTNLINLSP
jgi:ATP-binding cassette subfamily C protein LapB